MFNPIPELLTDDEYERLYNLKLLNHTAVRNHQIKFKFIRLKARGKQAWKAAGIIQRTYADLTRDTILQIALKKDLRITDNLEIKEWELK